VLFRSAACAEEHRWRELGLDAARAYELGRLAAAVLCGDPKVRPDAAVLRRILDRERAPESTGLKPRKVYAVPTVQAGQPAARFWRDLNLPIDVVVLNSDGGIRRL